ncbi:MAG: hypothetical protein ACHQK9_05060 [Reyranellales bacterium]
MINVVPGSRPTPRPKVIYRSAKPAVRHRARFAEKMVVFVLCAVAMAGMTVGLVVSFVG